MSGTGHRLTALVEGGHSWCCSRENSRLSVAGPTSQKAALSSAAPRLVPSDVRLSH